MTYDKHMMGVQLLVREKMASVTMEFQIILCEDRTDKKTIQENNLLVSEEYC